MSKTSASEHLRLMEQRIREQLIQIEKLTQEGSDSAEAKQRLNLLQHALEEMRAQLGPLSPTPLDGKRHTSPAKSPRQKR
jgi:hypothetical protein